MGEASRRKAINQHGYLKKLFGGKSTADQVFHQSVLANHKCANCNRPPSAIIRMFWPAADFQRDCPGVAMQMATDMAKSAPDGTPPCIPVCKFKGPDGSPRDFVCLPLMYFCGQCLPDAEKWAARKPSYVVVEVDRGPGVDKPQSQVPGRAESS